MLYTYDRTASPITSTRWKWQHRQSPKRRYSTQFPTHDCLCIISVITGTSPVSIFRTRCLNTRDSPCSWSFTSFIWSCLSLDLWSPPSSDHAAEHVFRNVSVILRAMSIDLCMHTGTLTAGIAAVGFQEKKNKNTKRHTGCSGGGGA